MDPAWDRTRILPGRLCSEAESTAASEHEVSTQSAIQRALQQDADCMSLDEVIQEDACIKVQGLTEEMRSVEEIERNLSGESNSEMTTEVIEEKHQEPVCDFLLLCKRKESCSNLWRNIQLIWGRAL